MSVGKSLEDGREGEGGVVKRRAREMLVGMKGGSCKGSANRGRRKDGRMEGERGSLRVALHSKEYEPLSRVRSSTRSSSPKGRKGTDSLASRKHPQAGIGSAVEQTVDERQPEQGGCERVWTQGLFEPASWARTRGEERVGFGCHGR